MKKLKFIIAIVVVVLLFFAVTTGIMQVFAQQSTPTPSSPAITPTFNLENRITDLENRMIQVETTQTQLIASLTSSNDQYKFLLTAFGAALGALVVIQGILQGVATSAQLRREGMRDTRQARREDEQDQVQYTGAKQVSEIMNVVKSTLESRLDAEQQAREEANKTRKDLDRVLNEVSSLVGFVRNYKTNIQNARQAIEDSASRLAQVPRHNFRSISNELNSFARQFESFRTEYEPLEEEPRRKFSARTLYIRGIAAHYANQPETAKRYLTEVTEFQQPELGDPDRAYKRRIANAYYYLGLTDSNFGNVQNAIDCFENANSLDPDGTDFLTKLVTAEAYIMKGKDGFDRAKQIIMEVEEGLRRKKEKEGRLAGVYLRLRSRATLILANMAILRREGNWWEEVQTLLKQVLDDDPGYYYATATLAQVNSVRDMQGDAQRLFREAYETIERSGDLFMVTEARSQILLRMVAGLCCLHGLMDKNRSEEHLDRADSLLGSLPKIDSQVCTVFSTLSKRNEKGETIHDHIELIRGGKVLLDIYS
jgi:tetratricopeptide (TPR) repeat protein